MRSLPIFVLAMTISTLAIINYQKSSSSTVAAILYALRTNERARELLGDEVYFAQRIPWISGQMAQMQGIIDISFRVRGTRGEGLVRFHSARRSARGVWETLEYWVEVDGKRVDLLDETDFVPIVLEKGEQDEVHTRGFRQANKP
jgi:cytochrome c oxidase assembly factor 1